MVALSSRASGHGSGLLWTPLDLSWQPRLSTPLRPPDSPGSPHRPLLLVAHSGLHGSELPSLGQPLPQPVTLRFHATGLHHGIRHHSDCPRLSTEVQRLHLCLPRLSTLQISRRPRASSPVSASAPSGVLWTPDPSFPFSGTRSGPSSATSTSRAGFGYLRPNFRLHATTSCIPSASSGSVFPKALIFLSLKTNSADSSGPTRPRPLSQRRPRLRLGRPGFGRPSPRLPARERVGAQRNPMAPSWS